jgi:hypothetical protein
VTSSALSMWPGNNNLLALNKTREPLRLGAGGIKVYYVGPSRFARNKGQGDINCQLVRDAGKRWCRDCGSYLAEHKARCNGPQDMFLDHKALGQLTAAQKKEKRRLTGLARNNGGSHVSTGLQVITAGYAIDPECLAWARRTHLEMERKEREKHAAGRLERLKLKGKVNVVLSKGPTPEEGYFAITKHAAALSLTRMLL